MRNKTKEILRDDRLKVITAKLESVSYTAP